MNVFEKNSYEPFYPRAGKARGARLVTRSGFILFDGVWTRLSTYRNPVVFLKVFCIAVLSALKRKAVRISGGRPFGIVHSIWTAGYYHWLTESLPRALVMKKQYPDVIPLLPSSRYIGFRASLNALGFDDVQYFPEGDNVLLEEPVLTECPARFGTTSPDLLREVRDRIWENLGISAGAATRIVYVSRAKARGRKVLNEEKVIELVTGLGGEVICFEDLNFAEQVRLMAETRVLVSIHGAGLTNMLFMPRGGTVVEFIPRKNGVFDYNVVRNSFRHDSCYVRLAAAMGHSYGAVVCRADNGRYEGTHMANIFVDVAEFSETLKKAMSHEKLA